MEDVGKFYGQLVDFAAIWYTFYTHLVYFVVIWYIFTRLVCCTKKNLATLIGIHKLSYVTQAKFCPFLILLKCTLHCVSKKCDANFYRPTAYFQEPLM
jgi:hypothetical protein